MCANNGVVLKTEVPGRSVTELHVERDRQKSWYETLVVVA
jgi:hypothetical protein